MMMPMMVSRMTVKTIQTTLPKMITIIMTVMKIISLLKQFAAIIFCRFLPVALLLFAVLTIPKA